MSIISRITITTFTFSLWLAASLVHASGFGDLPSEQQARAMAEFSEPAQRTQWNQPGRFGPMAEPIPNQDELSVQPYGAELFSGGFRGVRADGLNPDYKILPGDQVTLRIWGALEVDRVIPVDAQGNLFIPGIGPVNVMGVSHAQLDQLVRSKVQQDYPEDVNVYTNLQGVQPVAVFVTGFVNKPGRYAGVPADSVLYFIDQAAGVDEQLGSYRRVRIVRNNEVIADIDLYQFLLSGRLEHPQFQSGDTIIVDRRGPVVHVDGDVGRAYMFEMDYDHLTGADVMMLAQLNPGVTHALTRGIRQSSPFARYIGLNDFASLQIADGDQVLFFADKRSDTIVVQLEGAYLERSHFVVPVNTTLHQLLDNVPVDEAITETQSVSIRRLSVAEQQKRSLMDSLRRLETTFLGAPSSTVEESAIRVREAELITEFVRKAREVEPNGRLVVSRHDRVMDVRLQDGDIITLPERSDAILVSGEVFVPQSMVFDQRMSVYDYIEAAGGFSQHADKKRILVVRQNGEIRAAGDVRLRAGDEILILPKVSSKNLQLASTITQILYQIAVAAKIAIDI